MSQVTTGAEIMSVEDAAQHLRLPRYIIEQLAEAGELTAERVGDDWRISRIALSLWLSGRGSKVSVLRQAGSLADDPFFPEMLENIYRDRGRPADGKL